MKIYHKKNSVLKWLILIMLFTLNLFGSNLVIKNTVTANGTVTQNGDNFTFSNFTFSSPDVYVNDSTTSIIEIQTGKYNISNISYYPYSGSHTSAKCTLTPYPNGSAGTPIVIDADDQTSTDVSANSDFQNITKITIHDQGGNDQRCSNLNLDTIIYTINDIPTLTAFATVIDTTNEDTEVELTFTELTTQGDEADTDGTVDAFIVQAVSTGTLKIGSSSATATAYASSTNDTIDSSNNAYWTPALNANGTLNSFTVKAKDNDGGISTTAIQTTVSVTAVNDAPVINTIFNNFSLEENNGTTLYDINISDVDLDDLNLTIESNNTSILTVTANWSGVLDSSNWIKDFNLTTVANANGVVKITIRTTDGDMNTTKTFDVNVTTVDYAPVLETIADINKSEDDSSFGVTLHASDIDGDTISYEATSSDTTIATVSENSGVLTITPIANAHGIVTITVVATANGKSDTKSFKVNIAPVNDTPTITIDGNIVIDENGEQVLTFSYTDVDGDSVVVTTTQEPLHGTVIQNGSTITYTPYSDFSGGDSFVLSFDDGNGGIVDKTIVVVVNPISREVTVNTITYLISLLKDTNITVDAKSGTTTIIADSNVTTEVGFVYRVIVTIDKTGKSKSKIVRVNLATKEETLIDFTLKDGLWYKEGNSIEISIVDGMLQIKIVTKINEPLIIN